MILVGIIAGRVMMDIGGIIVEMDRDNALAVTQDLLRCIIQLDAGVSVKPTFTEFMEGFSA